MEDRLYLEHPDCFFKKIITENEIADFFNMSLWRFFLVFLVAFGHGQTTEFLQQLFTTTCPSSPANVTILGAGDVNYISEPWKYLIETQCNDNNDDLDDDYTVTTIEDTRSFDMTAGLKEEEELHMLSQLCRDPSYADIAATETYFLDFDVASRMNFVTRPAAGETDDGSSEYTLKCTESDATMFQVRVAYDAIALATINGTSTRECIESLPGGGLTLDQIRWMYSSYTLDELEASGWNTASVPLARDYGNERSWAALGGVMCFPSLIDIAGVSPPGDWETLESPMEKDQVFRMTIFKNWRGGETFRSDYVHTPFYNTQDFLTENPDGIAFYWYQDGGGAAHAPRPDAVRRVTDGFVSIAIQNDETLDFVAPSRQSISSSARVGAAGAIVAATSLYPPSLVRQFHWNIPNNGKNSPQDIAAKVGPLLNIGFSIDGDLALRNDDFLPLSVLEKSIMDARVLVGSGLRSSNSTFSVDCRDAELAGGSLVVGGASAVLALAELWAGVFETVCAPDAIRVNVSESVITAEGSPGSNNDTSSSEGARLVCGHNEQAGDIGTMDRDWLIPTEAKTSNQNGQFECADSGKQVLQVHVATQALSVVTSLQGSAFACLEHLGGLTTEELRWIFSSLSEQELINDGVVGVPSNSDGNDATHLWSELDIGNENGTIICPVEEILLAGPEESSFEYNFMSRLLFNQSLGETIDKKRETSDYSYFSSTVPQYIVDYLTENGNAIAFFPFGVAIANKNVLATAPLSDKMNPPRVIPDSNSVEAGSYPLAQALYMNLNMNETSLANSIPYVEFGLSPYGQRLAEMAGHVPLSNETLREMESRLAVSKNLSVGDSTSNTTTSTPVLTEPLTFSPAAPGGQDTQPSTIPSTPTQPSLVTGDASPPMVSPSPTTPPVLASSPPTIIPSNDGHAATIQPTTTERPSNETTGDEVDSSTRDSSSSSSSSGGGCFLKHRCSAVHGSTLLAIAALLFLM